MWDTAVRFFLLPLRVSGAGIFLIASLESCCCLPACSALCLCQASRLSSSRPETQRLGLCGILRHLCAGRCPLPAAKESAAASRSRDAGCRDATGAAAKSCTPRPPLQLCWREADCCKEFGLLEVPGFVSAYLPTDVMLPFVLAMREPVENRKGLYLCFATITSDWTHETARTPCPNSMILDSLLCDVEQLEL